MYKLVCLHIRLPTERFFTHITGIPSLDRTFMLMCLCVILVI